MSPARFIIRYPAARPIRANSPPTAAPIRAAFPDVKDVKVAQTLVLPLGNVEFYSDGTFGYRDARVGQAGRRPNSNQNILEIYPDGFTPFYTLKETDFQFTGGLRGETSGWNIDLSRTYGRNYAENGADNTLNASLGPSSPTEFKTFSSAFDQWTNNLDLTRRVELGGEAALQVSMGAEYRYESYVTKPLDVDSYRNGGYFYPTGPLAGRPAQVGAQGAIVVTPEDAADINRNIWAGYVDLALDVSPRFLVTAAGRFEHFDDSSGSVFSGKVSARYEVTDWLAFRGAFSNGFRAPSLAQQDFAQTSTSINLVGGVYIPVLTKIVKTNSAVAQALGAQALKPEKVEELQPRLHLDARVRPLALGRRLSDRSRRPHHPHRPVVGNGHSEYPDRQRLFRATSRCASSPTPSIRARGASMSSAPMRSTSAAPGACARASGSIIMIPTLRRLPPTRANSRVSA